MILKAWICNSKLVNYLFFKRSYAWDLVYKVHGYTNHTVLPEALEKWTVELFGNLLPRHLQIIYLINHFFLEKMKKKFPNDQEKLMNLSIIEESNPKMIRMANLVILFENYNKYILVRYRLSYC